ncbi:MAG TPA: cytochrome c oxidase subunit II [Chitinivibrionales bacterium]|nr:cytochrome c oxidase subunit II [Chitinivibrionales bacterium]
MATSTGIVNGALIYILAVSVLLFFLIVFFMAYFLVRYRASRNPVPSELPASRLIEALWVIVPTLIVMTMFFYGLTGFGFLRAAPKDSFCVKVLSRQWSWLFEYPNGKKSADLVVPMGRNVRCELVSADVIHGFYVPAFRIQQDAVPGMKTYVWFNATTPGTHYVLCSQYCGRKHSSMIARLYVVLPGQFDDWLKGKSIPLGNVNYANMPAGERLLFERGCISCHSLEGTLMVGPSLKGLFGSKVVVATAGVEHAVTADSAYLYRSIADPGADVVSGFPNTMPPTKDLVNDQEISQIIAYIKGLK